MTPKSTAALTAIILALGITSCSTTASDGRASLATGTVEDDIKLGQEAHPQILAQYGGAYDDPALVVYIDDIGQQLASVSEYADVPFTFTLLDSDIVNAFALPGGYVYISRGLLALAQDEAEVAGVIGHEIGHVTSRHGAERKGTQFIGTGLAFLGTIGGALLGGEAGARIGSQLGQLGGAGVVGQYSQSQEFESDKLGVRYLARAGYDTDAMGDFLQALQTNAELQAKLAGKTAGSASFDHFFSSHPFTPDRVTRARARSEERGETNIKRDRERFLAAIDGLVFGESPAQGFILGQRFAHPQLRFDFTVPQGYQLVNGTQKVRANGEGRQMQFDIDFKPPSGNLRTYKAESWVDMSKLDQLSALDLPSGYEGVIGFGNIKLQQGNIQGGFAIIRAPDDRVYRFAMLTERMTRSFERDLEATAQSLRSLTSNDAANLKAQRIQIVTVRSNDTIDSLAARMDVDNNARDWFVTMNGFDRGRELRAGDQVKLVVR